MSFDPDEFLTGFWAKNFGTSPPEPTSVPPLRSIGPCKLKDCPNYVILDSDSTNSASGKDFQSPSMEEEDNSSTNPMGEGDIAAAA